MRRVSSFSTSKVLNYPLLSALSQHQGPSQSDDGGGGGEVKNVSMYFVIPPGETVESVKGRNLGEMYLVRKEYG